MATTTHAVSTASTSNAASYASGAFTPAAGDLLVVFVVASGTVAAGSMSGSTGLTFYKATSAVRATSADTLYMFVAQALTTAVSQTVTFDCTGDNATGAIIQVVRIDSMSRTGVSAVKQTAKTDNAAAGTPAPAFGAACETANVTLGLVGNGTNPATMTTPSGWTELNDTGYNTPPTGAEYVARNSGFTGTTVTWGSSSASTFGAIIAEIDVSAAPASGSSSFFSFF